MSYEHNPGIGQVPDPIVDWGTVWYRPLADSWADVTHG